MADEKISNLSEITGAELETGDLFEVVDVDDTSGANAGAGGENKRITREELVAGLATRAAWDGVGAYTMSANERYVGLSTALTAGRSFRLPLANAVPAGAMITFADEVAGITTSFNVNVRVSSGSSNTIEGYFDATGAPTPTAAEVQYIRLRDPYASVTLMSDGTSKWQIVNRKPAIDVQRFTANGTWQRPLGFSQARIFLFGGGGGGASGRRGTSGTTYGGGGGGAGGVTVVDVPLADLPDATYTVTVGASAAGGAARTTTNNGANGTAGNVTWFGASDLWTAAGGGAGTGGSAAAAGDGGAGGAGMILGAGGGAGDGIAGTQGGVSSGEYANPPVIAPGAGGGGGWNSAGTTGFAGGAGGNSSGGVGTGSVGLAGGTAGATTPTAGGAGTAPTTISANTIAGGAGGGGGGSANGATASAGGAGAAPGGGGGGGGGSNNANSGAGAAGARGAVVIICW